MKRTIPPKSQQKKTRKQGKLVEGNKNIKDKVTGSPFTFGNTLWKQAAKNGAFNGRPKIFSTPEDLAAACKKYFDWTEANPLLEKKPTGFGGTVEIEKMRAMSIWGICTFLGITHFTWLQYRKREVFSSVVNLVDQIIREQKFAGAAAGLLNANIIARDLGLADKQEITGQGGSPLIPQGPVVILPAKVPNE